MCKKVVIIVGPTASGKTELSLRIAKIHQIEIVSADSRQIYSSMNIGTAKPTEEERAKAPHHCIDIKNPYDFFNAGEYCRLSRRIVNEIILRNHLPVIVGGSGLYVRALVDGVFIGNYRNTDVRKKFEKIVSEKGVSAIYKILQEVDPVASKRIHPNDQKRIIRALEVYTLSGVPISSLQKAKTKAANFIPQFWGLRWPRDLLYKRIDRRVDQMIKRGLVQEVKNLKSRGYDLRYNSLVSVGYKEILSYFEGEISLQAAIDLIKRNTRRFAKRQMTWFRKDPRIVWIDCREDMDWDRLAEQIIQKYEENPDCP